MDAEGVREPPQCSAAETERMMKLQDVLLKAMAKKIGYRIGAGPEMLARESLLLTAQAGDSDGAFA